MIQVSQYEYIRTAAHRVYGKTIREIAKETGQEAFFDGHIQGFYFFGGVFPVLIYDNLTTAVRRVLQGKNRILQESYLKFQGYYNFTPRFCNPSKGNENGGVEGFS
jgi:transposase